MLEQSKHPQLRRIVVLLLAFTVLAAYMREFDTWNQKSNMFTPVTH